MNDPVANLLPVADLARYYGDNARLTLAMVQPDTLAPFDATGYVLLFTVKVAKTDPDSAALIQKISVVGGITILGVGQLAVDLVPADDLRVVAGRTYYYDVQAQFAGSGAVYHVASGRLLKARTVTQSTTLSIPTTTTNPNVGYTWANIPDVPAAVKALGALTPAADMVPYFTGITAMAVTALTAFGRSLIGVANAVALRTLISAERARSYDVRDYGAVGDGTTDDTAACQAAIIAAGVGGSVIFPAGYTFKTTYSLVLLEGQFVSGGGTINHMDPTLFGCALTNGGWTTATAYNAAGRITIKDLTIYSPGGTAIGMGHAQGFTIKDIRVTGAYWHACDLTACKDFRVENVYLNNSINTNPNGAAIEVDQASVAAALSMTNPDGTNSYINADGTGSMNGVITGCVFRNPQSFGINMHRSGSQNISWIGNICDGCMIGAEIGEAGCTHTDLILDGNQFYNSTHNGIQASGATLIRTKIINNIVDTTGAGVVGSGNVYNGIWLDGGTLTDIDISGNTVYNFGGAAIRIQGATGFNICRNTATLALTGANSRGISIVGSSHGVCSNNIMDGQQTNSNAPGLYVVFTSSGDIAQDMVFDGNEIKNWGIGVYLKSNANNLTFTNNNVDTVSGYGFELNDTTNVYVLTNIKANGNRVANSGLAAFRASNITHFSFNNNTVASLPNLASAHGIYLLGANHGSVSHNIIYGSAGTFSQSVAGICLNNLSAAAIHQDIQVSNNSIMRVYRGIYTPCLLKNCGFNNNTVSDIDDRGVLLGDGSGTYSVLNSTCNGNTVRLCRLTGILAENAGYSTFLGNSIFDPTNGGNGTAGRGIQLSIGGTINTGSYNIVSENVLDGGADDPNETSQYGIYIGTAYTSVTNNKVARFKTGVKDTGALTALILTGNTVRLNGTNLSLASTIVLGTGQNYIGSAVGP